MADEEDEVEELPVVSAAGEKKQNPFIPIGVAVILAAGIGWAVSEFFVIPKIHEVNAEHGGDGPEAQKKAVEELLAAQTYKVEGITANLSGELRGRYIKVSLMLEGTNPQFKEIMEKNEAKIKDATLKTLTTLDIRSAQQDGIIGILSGQLISTINKNLHPAPEIVEKLYFSEFIIQ
jgi:flagellar basal body-associated protein FliL